MYRVDFWLGYHQTSLLDGRPPIISFLHATMAEGACLDHGSAIELVAG
jgi:hypothetical protein